MLTVPVGAGWASAGKASPIGRSQKKTGMNKRQRKKAFKQQLVALVLRKMKRHTPDLARKIRKVNVVFAKPLR